MRPPPPRHPAQAKQRGAALMVMLVIMVMGIAAILVSSLNSSTLKNTRQEKTAEALAQAKNALIGYAITYGDTHTAQVHGYLPCPDINGNGSGNSEGSSELTCGSKNVSSIGRLPWKTLDLPALRDGDGECLWYAVSGTFQSNQKTDLMNWDSNGLLEILDTSGATIAQNVVAVVLAPSTVLGNQNHAADGNAPTCGGNYTATNYLDNDGTINNAAVSGTANAISQFRAGITPQINDQMIFITKSDIFNAIKKRNDFGTFVSTLFSSTATCLAALPAPVTVDFNNTPPTEISGGTIVGSLITGRIPKACLASPLDNWQDNLLYAKCTSGLGCLTVNSINCKGVVIFSGERMPLKTRITNTDKNTWDNYLEDTPSTIFTAFTTGATSFTGAASYSAASPSTDVLACIP
jgi:type II secretory pathway pseudopilin PulG